VMIAIDGSSCSNVAFESVLHRQWSTDDVFRIFSVVELIIGEYPMAMTYVDAMVEAQQDLVRQARELVQTKMAMLQSQLPQNKVTGDVMEGPVADMILAQSKHWQADLIVLGSHGRKGFTKFLLGSVAEKVASHATCSVEIIRQSPTAPAVVAEHKADDKKVATAS